MKDARMMIGVEGKPPSSYEVSVIFDMRFCPFIISRNGRGGQ